MSDDGVYDCFGHSLCTNASLSKYQLKKQKKLAKKANRGGNKGGNNNKGRGGGGSNKVCKGGGGGTDDGGERTDDAIAEEIKCRLSERRRPEDESIRQKLEEEKEAEDRAGERVPVNGVPSIVIGTKGDESHKYKVLMQARTARRREEKTTNGGGGGSSDEEEEDDDEELEYDQDDDIDDDGKLCKRKSASTRSLNLFSLSTSNVTNSKSDNECDLSIKGKTLGNQSILLSRLNALTISKKDSVCNNIKVNGVIGKNVEVKSEEESDDSDEEEEDSDEEEEEDSDEEEEEDEEDDSDDKEESDLTKSQTKGACLPRSSSAGLWLDYVHLI